MFKNIIPFALFILTCCSLSAQIPREVFLMGPLGKPTIRNHARANMMCNEAGTIAFDTFTGESSDAAGLEANGLDDQPIYLCAEDAFSIVHNGDQDLSGDPNMATDPGIGYAFYQNGPPTIDGFFLDTILKDPNIIISPNNSESPFVYVDNPNGNAQFQNTVILADPILGDLTLQDIFNSGNPVQLWFAPITYDSLSTGFVAGYEGNPIGGPCVDVNIEEAFSVVYLNPFELLAQTPAIANGCNGTITSSMNITGGLPEFDEATTQYNISIVKSDDASVTGTIGASESRIPNTPINFSVPEAGIYTVRVSDGKSCDGSFDIDLTNTTITIPAITLASADIPLAGSPCMGRFVISGGGLPELDDTETYSVSIADVSDPSILGTIRIGNNPRRNQGVTFEVPQSGDYRITIQDRTGCEFSFVETFTACNSTTGSSTPVTFVLEDLTIARGDQVCTNITVQDFTNIDGLQFSFSWDPTILEYQNIETGDEFFLKPSDFGVSAVADGFLFGQWFDASGNSANLMDGDTLFRVCFMGLEFGNSPLEIVDDPRGLEIEVIQSGQPIMVNQIPGSVNVPDGNFSFSTTTQDACDDMSTGGITLNIQSGVAPYMVDVRDENGDATSFVVNTPFIDTTLTGFPIGEYTVLVRDAGGAFDTEDNVRINTTNVTINPLILQLPLCFGDSTGAMRARVFEGTTELSDLQGYTFEWSSGENTQVASRLFVGDDPFTDFSQDFTVTVTDPNGCIKMQTQGLPQPDPISIGAITNDVSATCSGSNDGVLSLDDSNTSGGTGNITYAWDNQQVGSTLQNLDVGTYIVTATDENLCEAIDSADVTTALELILNPAIDSITCIDANDAAIQVTRESVLPGSIDPNIGFRFEWTDASGATLTPSENGAISRIEDLAPGMYAVKLSIDSPDPALDVCSTTSEFEIFNPDSLLIQNIAINKTTNCRVPNGRAELEVVGGTGAGTYSYAWEFNGAGQINAANNAIATNLAPDSVFILVTDANDCVAMLDTIIGSPERPSVTDFENAAVDCNADTDGFLQVNAVKGDADIVQYQWSHNGSVSTNFAAQLGPDTYIVTITDENDCTTIDSAVVDAPPAIFFSEFEVQQVPCFEEDNGKIQLTALGGAAGFTYEWEDENSVPVGEDADSLVSALAGVYTLTATDANGCAQDTMVELGSQQAINVEFMDVGGTSCFDNGLNDRDGTARAIVTYADGTSGDFDFFWGNNEQTRGDSESVADSLGSGTIELLVFESIGICRTKDSIEIPSPPRLEYDALNSNSENITCFNGSDGAIDVVAIGGTPGYTYEWNTGDDLANISGLSVGTYTISITDANECLATHEIQISQPDSLLVAIDFEDNNTRNVQCSGDEDGQISLDVSGGNPGEFTYRWTDDVSNTSIATALPPGMYAVTVIDSEGCSGDASYEVAQPPAIAYNVTNEPIICNDFPTTIVADANSFSGGNGGDYTYSVDNSPSQSLDKVFQVKAGEHLLTVYDALGCAYEEVITIEEPEAINIEFPDAENTGRNFVSEVQLGGAISLNPDIFSPIPIADINWTSDSNTDTNFVCLTPLCENPTVSPLNDIFYTITVTDQNGCSAEASVLVEVDKKRNIFIPNAFAPNSRGFDLNESFKIYSGVGVETINFARVFNRWGTMVASLEDATPSASGVKLWDGRLKGQKIAQGVYVYIVSVTFTDNVTLLYRGDVTLLR